MPSVPQIIYPKPRSSPLFPNASGYGASYSTYDAASDRFYAGLQQRRSARAATDRSADTWSGRMRASRTLPRPSGRPVLNALPRPSGQPVSGMGPPRLPPPTGRPVAGMGPPSLPPPTGRPVLNTLPNPSGRPVAGMPPPKGIVAAAKAGPRMKMPTKIGLGIGAAAAVGVLMNRSGRSDNRGRQSAYRY